MTSYDERPDAADLADPPPPRTEENACPECETGVVVPAGPMERETGHWPLACSASCGWSN